MCHYIFLPLTFVLSYSNYISRASVFSEFNKESENIKYAGCNKKDGLYVYGGMHLMKKRGTNLLFFNNPVSLKWNALN